MNTNFKFNHEADNLPEALGVNAEVIDTLNDGIIKVVEVLKKKSDDSMTLSDIVEQIPEAFTDEQIVILAATFIKDVILDKQQRFSGPMAGGFLEMLKDMAEKSGNTEDLAEITKMMKEFNSEELSEEVKEEE